MSTVLKRIVQIVAALNAIFQIAVGLMSIASPTLAASSFKVDARSSVVILALIRMFGGLLASSGIISALLARDPYKNVGLARPYAACLLLNVSADLVVIATGELRWDQLVVGMVLELVLATLLLVAAPRATATEPG